MINCVVVIVVGVMCVNLVLVFYICGGLLLLVLLRVIIIDLSDNKLDAVSNVQDVVAIVYVLDVEYVHLFRLNSLHGRCKEIRDMILMHGKIMPMEGSNPLIIIITMLIKIEKVRKLRKMWN